MVNPDLKTKIAVSLEYSIKTPSKIRFSQARRRAEVLAFVLGADEPGLSQEKKPSIVPGQILIWTPEGFPRPGIQGLIWCML